MIFYDWRDLIQASRHVNGDLYIAGAGYWGTLLGEYFNRHHIIWKGFLDKRIFNHEVCCKEVFAYDYIADLHDAYVVVSSPLQAEGTMAAKIGSGNSNQILLQLRDVGINEEYIFVAGNTTVMMDIMNELYGIYDEVSRIGIFKDKYKDRRCFVIGNGPSLMLKDLEKIRNEVTFASNTIYALYESLNWRPTYYCVIDALMSEIISREKKLPYLLSNCSAMFSALNRYRYLITKDNFSRNLYFFRTVLEGVTEDEIKFSSNAQEVLYAGGSVTYFMLQLAVYMGFTEIYLLGVDCSYSVEQDAEGNIKIADVTNHNHIIEDEEKKYYPLMHKRFGYSYFASIDLQIWGYRAARRYADSHGIKIYNATRGGKLEVFERVSFDNLFDK